MPFHRTLARAFTRVGKGIGRGLARRPEFTATGLTLEPGREPFTQDLGGLQPQQFPGIRPEVGTRTLTAQGQPAGVSALADFLTGFGGGPQAAQAQQRQRSLGIQQRLQSQVQTGQADLEALMANLELAPKLIKTPNGLAWHDIIKNTITPIAFATPEGFEKSFDLLRKEGLSANATARVSNRVAMVAKQGGDVVGAYIESANKELSAQRTKDAADLRFKREQTLIEKREEERRKGRRPSEAEAKLDRDKPTARELALADIFKVSAPARTPEARTDQLIEVVVGLIRQAASEENAPVSLALANFFQETDRRVLTRRLGRAFEVEEDALQKAFIQQHRAEIERRVLGIRVLEKSGIPSVTGAIGAKLAGEVQ